MPATLDLDCLRTFAAVADTGSFTAAGERVSRTQSAVSMQVRRLEETLGRPVLLRNSRGVALTPEGAILLEQARRLLDLNDETLRRVARPGISGRVRLGVTEYFVPERLPGILARFASAHPAVELEVRMGLSRELREALAAGRLDAALVRLESREGAAALWTEPQVWAAAEGWSAARGTPVPLVLLPAPCPLREHAIASFRRRGAPARVAYTGSSMASVQAAVLAGLGVSILPRSSVRPGMREIPSGRAFPDPGVLRVGVLEREGAGREIVAALEEVCRESLGAAAAARHAG